MLLENSEPPPQASPKSSNAGKVLPPKLPAERVSDGAVDIRGNLCVKSTSGNWKACCLIFGCEVCERVAFYAISSNLVIYLTTVLHEDVSMSAKNVNNWGGTTFMTPLLGAFVADAFLGRYWTITGFSCCYFLVTLILNSAFNCTLFCVASNALQFN